MYGLNTREVVEDLQEALDENGKRASPTFSVDIKNYLIDIDGTIGEDIPNEEPERMVIAKAYPDALDTINRWFEEGHQICFFTARTEEHREVTENWLNENGFKYHSLLLGKPRGGNYHWIDNHSVKATQYKSNFTNLIRRKIEIEVFDDE